MNWDSIPNAEEVKDALDTLARARTQLRMFEFELEVAQSEVSQRAPRNKAARIIGVDEESRVKLYALQLAVLAQRGAVEELEATVSLNRHRLDMAKSLSYRGRF